MNIKATRCVFIYENVYIYLSPAIWKMCLKLSKQAFLLFVWWEAEEEKDFWFCND